MLALQDRRQHAVQQDDPHRLGEQHDRRRESYRSAGRHGSPLLPAVRTARRLLTGKPGGKSYDTPGDGTAKNHSSIRRDSTKKQDARLDARTETLTTPRGYCAVKTPCVPGQDKGFSGPAEGRITLRVGNLTTGNGSKRRVGCP
ncbi:hypothetical protein GCM10023237_23540 [Streptomyces coeruleoprunus]